MPCPAFAEAWAVQESVDCRFRIVDVGLGGWQTGQIESDAAVEFDGRGVGDGVQAFGFKGSEDEAIDVRAGPRGIFDFWHRRIREGLEGPVLAGLPRCRWWRWSQRSRLRGIGSAPS